MLPNSERAIVEPSKVRDYLLSPAHPVGRFKAAVFAALGYTHEQWETLQSDLLAMGRTNSAVAGQVSFYVGLDRPYRGRRSEVGNRVSEVNHVQVARHCRSHA